MSPQDVRAVMDALNAARTSPEGAQVLFQCMCGWESPCGPRRESLRAFGRHLARCH